MRPTAPKGVRSSIMCTVVAAVAASSLGCNRPARTPEPGPVSTRDTEFEQKMTTVLTEAGADRSRLEIRCRNEHCEVSCKPAPTRQCVADLHRATAWGSKARTSEALPMFSQIRHNDDKGIGYYSFCSKECSESLLARRQLFQRMATRLANSPAIELCRKNAVAHGLALLTVEISSSGSPTVTVSGEIENTPEADCVVQAMLAIVVDEKISTPMSNREFPIAINI